MSETSCNSKNYLFTLAIGVIVGGITIAWATKALPKMMHNMMARMGCNPAKMCQEMMGVSVKPDSEKD
ncbi:hypothetical protein ACFLYI_00505 [Chloroflexota bacterium]